jgi:hypothetical protein
MNVFDEMKHMERLESMTFVDFLEALGRACDFKDFPSAKQLKDKGYATATEYLDDLAAGDYNRPHLGLTIAV